MKKAFTLAEVLITLAIIGIVAAITIPSVIANYQQQEFKTGLRKAVSVLNEAIQANISYEGQTPYDRGPQAAIGQENGLDYYLTRHMSVIKTSVGMPSGAYTHIDGVWYGSSKNHAFYTTDGMRFEIPPHRYSLLSKDGGSKSDIKLHESNINIANQVGATSSWESCGSYGLANNPHGTTQPPCFVLVDVNGDRKPTVYSTNKTIATDGGSVTENYKYPNVTDKRVTDIFPIMITEDRAIPFGVVAQRAMYSK